MTLAALIRPPRKVLVLTLGDLELLKQLRAAGGCGRNVRELNIRVTLDRH
jgi:hypothetical protein